MIDYAKKFMEVDGWEMFDPHKWLKSQLQARDKEIEELKFENEQTTKERDNHLRDIIKLENELSELKDENEHLNAIHDNYFRDLSELKALKVKIDVMEEV